jgi:3D (Asp-Asp-Asp) domain-containing protein
MAGKEVIMARIGIRLFAIMMATIMLLAFSLIASAEQSDKTVAVKVSAYSLFELNNIDGKTASGRDPKAGYIAISRDLEKEHGLKFGDRVNIKGLGIFEIQDRTSEKKKNWVDVYMTSYRKAVEFGIKSLKMIIPISPVSTSD